MQKTYAFEDFTPGRVFELGARVVDREEGLSFARTFDPQPLHLDEEAANASVLGGLSVSGWHTCAMVMRLMCDAYLLDSTSQGSPGIDNLRWLKPVRPGDTIRVRMTVQQSKSSRSRPNLGLVRSAWEVLNQNDEVVMTMEGWGMFTKRNTA